MRFLAIRSLRWRLVAVMFLAYVIVAVTTLAVGYGAQRDNLRRQLTVRARSDAAILAAGSVSGLTNGNLGTLKAFVASLSRAQGVKKARVLVEDGRIVASTQSGEVGTRVALPVGNITAVVELSNGDVESSAPIAENTELGVATVVLSGASIQDDLRNLLILETVTRLLGLVIFIMLSLIISRYILGGLGVLAHAAQSLRQGHLDTRVPVQGQSELDTLAETFNDMAGVLEERIGQLSFLAYTGAQLPATFREDGNVRPILRQFCDHLGCMGAGLFFPEDPEDSSLWYEPEPDRAGWRGPAMRLGEHASAPVAGVRGGFAVMAVPVLGNRLFVTARRGKTPFSAEEQQVITNFAYQLGIAADNALLSRSQQEALQVKDQFLSIVSHELRTPLTTIKGYSQMLRRKLSDEPDGQRFADNIDSQVSRLSRLVDDLLDVTRFTRGQFELMPQRMDLRPLLEEAVSRFRLVTKIHTIDLNLDDGPCQGYWDHDRLEQVVNNLIGNAIKYSPKGGEIVVSTQHEHGRIVVRVRDHGIGISDTDREHLFERFFRGSFDSQEFKGMGLGLYVTRRIVEAHGGDIDVTSVPGEGSEFSFWLPLAHRPALQEVAG